MQYSAVECSVLYSVKCSAARVIAVLYTPWGFTNILILVQNNWILESLDISPKYRNFIEGLLLGVATTNLL